MPISPIKMLAHYYCDEDMKLERHMTTGTAVFLGALVLGILAVSTASLIHVLGNKSIPGINTLSDAMGKNALKGISMGAGSTSILILAIGIIIGKCVHSQFQIEKQQNAFEPQLSGSVGGVELRREDNLPGVILNKEQKEEIEQQILHS